MQATLPRSAYLSEAHFETERERVFSREWFCIGREEAIPSGGDYLHVLPAGQSVLVVRTHEGAVRAFYNVCRHRGSRLVVDGPGAGQDPGCPSGRFKKTIRCPYHSWTYGLDGELRHAPYLDETVGLRKDDLSLFPVEVDTWKGFIFVRLEPSGSGDERSSLAAQLVESTDGLAHYPLEELRSARRITYSIAANWKCILENYNECYHCASVHPELCEIVPAFKTGGAGLNWDEGIPHREGANTFSFTGVTDRAPFSSLTQEERNRHKGELVYPNLMLSASPDHVTAFVLWPESAAQTKIECDFLFHPQEMSRPGFDPSDAEDFWELVNRQDWRMCESVQLGMSARPFRFGYYAPMGDESLDIRRYVARLLDDSGASENEVGLTS